MDITGSRRPGSALEVLGVFSRLGLTSFGGPVAHLGYFHEAFVVRRGWLSERAYADLVAFCQFLPGPASSQVGMAIGWRRAGIRGLLAAWAGFTLPSALLLLGFAYGVGAMGDLEGAGWITGLKAAAVAVVAQAVLGMARTLASGPRTATIAGGAVIALLLLPATGAPLALVQVAVIVAAGLAGLWWVAPPSSVAEGGAADGERLAGAVRPGAAIACLVVFGLGLAVLPLLAAVAGAGGIAGLVDTFYRAGSLVFGGGHVVLPLLQAETAGTVTHDEFLAGYGAAQAVPGPLFTFAGYLGAVSTSGPGGALGAAIALVAVFTPSALLVVGALPYWDRLRRAVRAQRALAGVNAGVVGLLAAAFYDPVLTQGVLAAPSPPSALALVVTAYVALTQWRTPPWAVVVAAGAVGGLLL
ncbi:chromate efflux transporter [Myceligenerans pegani]|uniref:Chromate efflux transporter n=1 Tax=Myceligenerans pegani TaxID=2776917 RepID=A0ABR9N4Q0_9MICO|nr:chromate efflux transporter [Myceligenerans sp. TRM 65318]MBE1878151.1 chromate efflux transporter [Myceligenerans sp. TRM 65318]MBE3020422.1 chromate efflux transporter [Myceligenerans sp. TRM 65318]